HGGLRYLQNGDVRLVYEALRERQRLLRNAPHLVKVLPFLIPVFTGKGGIIPRQVARALGSAMWMYDLTGGLRIGRVHRRLPRERALTHMPTLDERLAWAYLYYDAQADAARLTLTVLRTAALDHGATVVNHAPVTGLVTEGGQVRGARVDVDGDEVEVRARVVVNATGVWSDEVRALAEGAHPRSIRPAKGIHITVPWEKVRNDIATGTTGTDSAGDLDDPPCTAEDVAYLLEAVNDAITGTLTEHDVLGTWAGLRPLVSDATSSRTADLSRRHRVTVSDSGLVTVTGGKLTTYREMAEDTVDTAVRLLGGRPRGTRRCRTRSLRLRGAEGWEEVAEEDRHLAERYGGEARVVQAMIEADPSLGEPLVPGLPYRRAEALYAVRYEMATTLDDVLSRRTRARLRNRDATAAAADEVAALVGPELGWSDEDRAAQVAAYRASSERERQVPDLPRLGALAGG